MSILVAYATKHGSTGEIAERIAATLRGWGQTVEVRPIGSVGDVKQYDACVVGSAVYFGSWTKEATEFVGANSEVLATRPIWLFSSGPTGEATQPEPKQVTEFRGAIQPRDHRMFGGQLDRHKLSFPERMIIKGVKAPEGDFRDWGAIDAWADSIARALAPSATTA